MRRENDWEIEFSEIEMGDLLGAGGFGQVHKAMWKGTEVAVKVIAGKDASKEMQKSFIEEVWNSHLTASRATYQFNYLNTGGGAGARDDFVEASERGSVHGCLHTASHNVHSDGIHEPWFSL